MKIKRKGKKVHPSPPQTAATPPPPYPPSTTQDSLSVLNLLPAAIFALVAALSFQDREVLAYMITRSLKTTTTAPINASSPSVVQENLKPKLKKTYSFHKSPVFDCECFECYTSFWFRWDSSANREVIHQAIEAFEEHLASGELEMKRNRRGKKKDKLPIPLPPSLPVKVIDVEPPSPVIDEDTVPEPVADRLVELKPIVVEVEVEIEAEAAVATTGGHRGFPRKVLRDVLGVFNSRLWNLWGPNV